MDLRESVCLLVITFIFLPIQMCKGLECYVCTNQEANTEKCLKTIKTCDQEEDACLSTINWGSPPYWSQGATKQYYVSKSCASKKYCEEFKKKNMPSCTYIWYQDWKCSECCSGDRCNYFVTLGSSSVKSNTLIISLSAITLLCIFYRGL
uniref:Uncharacterized protein n=1 Tax=Cacopsylla melanoneura TaxID=428564 RepID=A0A8D8ZMK0_9HEMI